MAFSFAKLTSAVSAVTENETFASASSWLSDTISTVTGSEATSSASQAQKPGAIILPQSNSTNAVKRS